MNEQERTVIAGIFQRLEQAAGQPRDPEADRFIAERIQRQPYAPYAMAQTIFVQEQALTNLHGRVQELEAEVERLRSQPQSSGGFLSGLFGGGASSRPEPRMAPPAGGMAPGGMAPGGMAPGAAPGGPWGGRPGATGPSVGPQGGPWGGQAGAPAQRGGSGFLGTAMATAAGVAGGMVLGNVLASAFAGDKSAEAAGLTDPAAAQQASAEAPDTGGGFGAQDNIHQASAGMEDDFGAFDDGGDDWA